MTAEPCPDKIRTRGKKPHPREFYGRPPAVRSSRALHPLKGGEKERSERKPHPASPQGRRKGEKEKGGRKEGRKQIKNARTCVRAFFNYIGLPRTT